LAIEASLCHIVHGRKLLLKKANRGISRGKWNAPGGKLERGETPEHNVVREVMEETTLRIISPFYHGKIEFYMNGGNKLDYLVHVFSARGFSGKPRSSKEGNVRWFGLDNIPYHKMWDDDRYWLPLLLNGVRFDARFYYDRKNERVIDYEIGSRPRL
jgi:8-oxo-dGTP diphosphatase